MIDSQTLTKLKKLIGKPPNANWEHLGYPVQAWIAGLCKIIDDASQPTVEANEHKQCVCPLNKAGYSKYCPVHGYVD